jgi:hypothetical protein
MKIMDNMVSVAIGVVISVIGYFLRKTIEEVKEVKSISYQNKTKIEVMENDYINKINNLNQKFDMLYNAIDKLTLKIDQLNNSIR